MRFPVKPRSCSMTSSREPSGANAFGSSNDALTKYSDSAKIFQTASSGGRREKCTTPSFAKSRYASSVRSPRPMPTTAKRGGSRPSTCRLYSAGSSLRCARSPVPPKITSVTGSAASGCARPALKRSNSDSDIVLRVRFLHGVSAELVAQRGEHALAERVVAARSEACEERRGQRGHRHRAIDPLVERPASFAGVLDVRLERLELGILLEGARRQFEEPGADDAALHPEGGDRRQIDRVVAGVHQIEA